jgi:hypothetical protein
MFTTEDFQYFSSVHENKYLHILHRPVTLITYVSLKLPVFTAYLYILITTKHNIDNQLDARIMAY